jgi:hypothetical protein
MRLEDESERLRLFESGALLHEKRLSSQFGAAEPQAMAITNQERVGNAMELLRAGLPPTLHFRST